MDFLRWLGDVLYQWIYNIFSFFFGRDEDYSYDHTLQPWRVRFWRRFTRSSTRRLSKSRAKSQFDPSTKDLTEIRDAAVRTKVFARLGVEWVPQEYLAILAEWPDPVDALYEFCERFGLLAHELIDESGVEHKRFVTCISIFMELHELTKLPCVSALTSEERNQIHEFMRQRQYDFAEMRSGDLRRIFTILSEGNKRKEQIVFSAFPEFLVRVEALRARWPWSDVHEEMDSAWKEYHQWLRAQEWVDRLLKQQIFERLVEIDDCLQKVRSRSLYPFINQLNGLIYTAKQLELKLKSATLLDLAQLIREMKEIADHVNAFWDKVSPSFGKTSAGAVPSENQDHEEYDQARSILGLSDANANDPVKITQAYRKLAFKYHPDRFVHATPEETIEHEKKFKAVVAARNLLEKFVALRGRV